MTVAPCETFGRWHRWHTVEIVDDVHTRAAGHSLHVLRCDRCGVTSWRWGPVTSGGPHGHANRAA